VVSDAWPPASSSDTVSSQDALVKEVIPREPVLDLSAMLNSPFNPFAAAHLGIYFLTAESHHKGGCRNFEAFPRIGECVWVRLTIGARRESVPAFGLD
jgi:hypothetical protein